MVSDFTRRLTIKALTDNLQRLPGGGFDHPDGRCGFTDREWACQYPWRHLKSEEGHPASKHDDNDIMNEPGRYEGPSERC